MGIQPQSQRSQPAYNGRISGANQIGARIPYSFADIFIRYAKPGPDILRPILDGPPNLAKTREALSRYVDAHRGCYGSGRGFYALGAALDYALRTYQPTLRLTTDETHREDTIARFRNREQARNRFRRPEDLAYFKAVVCMVQAQPQLASDLASSQPATELSDRLGFTIINRAHGGIPYARHIQVDPTQFRIYVLAAFYRWAEAVEDVDSLVPNT